VTVATAALLLLTAGLPGETLSGSYVGNGLASQQVDLGFRPDVLFIKRDGAPEQAAVLKLTSMPAGLTKPLDDVGRPLTLNLVLSLNATGFTVGSHPAVNEAGVTFHYVAFTQNPPQLVVGTYDGDGASEVDIPTGFQPVWVVVVPDNMMTGTDGVPVSALSTALPNTSFDFNVAQVGPGVITTVHATGFKVGLGNVQNGPSLNANGTTYYYAAWAQTPGRVAAGKYVGDSLDARNVNAAGFFPAWVLVKAADGLLRPWVHKPASTGTGVDTSHHFVDAGAASNCIQELRPLGFQVGTDDRVNSATTCGGACEYHWLAFGPFVPDGGVIGMDAGTDGGAMGLDAGSDGGAMGLDAGSDGGVVGLDAGNVFPDGGMTVDSGITKPDAGIVPSDGGKQVLDGGERDAGRKDAGEGEDAGASDGGARGDVVIDVGCGCTSGAGVPFALLLAGLGFALRRRRVSV